MKELDEVLELLRNAMPLLKKFGEWQKQQELREKEEQEQVSESEKLFDDWLKERRKKQQEEDRDADRLAERFFGEREWQRERFAPRRY